MRKPTDGANMTQVMSSTNQSEGTPRSSALSLLHRSLQATLQPGEQPDEEAICQVRQLLEPMHGARRATCDATPDRGHEQPSQLTVERLFTIVRPGWCQLPVAAGRSALSTRHCRNANAFVPCHCRIHRKNDARTTYDFGETGAMSRTTTLWLSTSSSSSSGRINGLKGGAHRQSQLIPVLQVSSAACKASELLVSAATLALRAPSGW